MEVLHVVYGVRLKADDEYRYVGLTRFGASYRLNRHFKDAKHPSVDKAFYQWLRKHGSHAIIADVIDSLDHPDDELLNFKEQFWIATFNQQYEAGLKKKKLFNLTEGGGSMIHIFTAEWRIQNGLRSSARNSGSGNPTYGTSSWNFMTDEMKKATKAKISASTSGVNNPMYGKRGKDSPASKLVGEANGFYGKHHSDEVKKRLSDALRGVPKSDETRQRMAEAARIRSDSGVLKTQGQYAMHIRWHVSRKLKNDKCKFCVKND